MTTAKQITEPKTTTMVLSDTFRRLKAPETGRNVVQLTCGEGFCYPLYYFIRSITKDLRYLIHHRASNGEVQLFRLDLASGESLQISRGACQNTWWYPWCVDSGRGVLDHRSVLNVERGEVLYFDGNHLHVVDVETLTDKILFSLPDDRISIGQNCATPDGKWFIYIHHDRIVFTEQIRPDNYWQSRHFSKGTELCAYNFDTNENRLLVKINSPIHHVVPYNNEHFIFCHPTTENGMLLTDLKGGWFKQMRTQDAEGGCVCHYVATRKGVAFEILRDDNSGALSGIYDPLTDSSFEFRLPSYFGYTHTGCDDEGRLWFYESNKAANAKLPDSEGGVHDMHFLVNCSRDGNHEWLRLIGNWPTYLRGQKSHFHPRVTPDRNWIIFTAGDAQTRSNQIYLLDVSDLNDTTGIYY